MSLTPFNPVGLTVGFTAATVAPTPVQVPQLLVGMPAVTAIRVVNTGTTPVFMGYGTTAAAATLAAIVPTTASVTGSISGTTLTVTAVDSGTLFPNQLLAATGLLANTTITQQISGTAGGVGVYRVSTSQTLASTTITTAGAPTIVLMPGVVEVFTVSDGTYFTGLTSSGTAIVYLLAGDGV